ncbi:major capsid protein P2 [Roseateles violae]|uniref:Major capsid protein P2 n=1 Tax=Roseateles violae TaxID=3058042 RepID=A0ABT8E0F1_9BURK|nr:major capsid protein P2 [Pelomonas sp. PFR6]MDN3923341.1 major capsid protein P2 [Pelomonas sp. PFR6]
MIYLPLNPFNPVALGVRSTVQVQRYDMTLARVVLNFPGANAITKATISEIVVKIGARVVFGPITGLELDAMNKYRGIYDRADALTIDFTERDALSVVGKEIGGIDIPALYGQDIFIEVVNNAGAGTPTLTALAGFTALQFDPSKPNPDGQLIKKVLAYQIPTSGGTAVTWTPVLKGAVIQRIHLKYAGTDWAGSTDGNLARVEVKKNGVAVHGNVNCNLQRYLLQEQRKVPQSKFYHLDFVHDNVHSAALATADARALEFNFTLAAPDTIRAIVECLDTPGNL